MNRLTKLANKYGTDKGTGHLSHGFTEFYYDYFKKYESPTILTFGVLSGATERMLNDFYDKDCQIYCVDIENLGYLFEGDDNIHFFKANLSDEDEIKNLANAINGIDFDIIIDDASHHWEDQMLCLKYFSPYLKDNGVYVLEDLHTSYMFGDVDKSPLFFVSSLLPVGILSEDDELSIIDKIKTVSIFSNKSDFLAGGCNGRSITSVIQFCK